MKLHCGWPRSTGLAVAALMVAALLALACSDSGASSAGLKDSQRRLAPALVQRGDLTVRTLLTGELEAADAERLVAPNVNVWPLQIRWLAEDGIEVRKGDKVVEFDNSQLVSSVEEMKAQAIEAANQLASLRARSASEEANATFELQQRQAALAKAELDADVPIEVYAEVDYRKRQLDLRKAELELAEAEAKQAATRRAKQAEIEIQQIALDNARTQVRRSMERIALLTLTASRDGILVLGNNRDERPWQAGDSIYPGAIVARLPDLSTLRIAARLFDVDDGLVTEGMSTIATLDTFPELAFSGQIREIDQIADQASSRSLRRFFRAKIDLDRVDIERMRPGMSVKVLIEAQHQGVLIVPRDCIDWSSEGPRAKLEDGSWTMLSLGPCNAANCILESGLGEATVISRLEAAEA